MSFSSANNLGVKHAEGDFLLFLNNDTEVTDGWLDELLIASYTLDNVGAVGAKLIYPKIPAGATNEKKSYRIQHAGIAFKYNLQQDNSFIQPYNMENGYIDDNHDMTLIERSAVTGAVLLMSRKIFDEIDGFDEKYNYGYEDVDICLKLKKAGYKNYYCPSCLVYHYEFGSQDQDIKEEVKIRRLHNREVFKGKWQRYLTQQLLYDKLNNHHIYTSDHLTIGLVVTENNMATTVGDFFTAMELGNSLKKLGYSIKYLARKDKHDWYDIGKEVDVIISFLDIYNINKIYNYRDDLIKIAWARNWFSRWCEREFFESFDIVLASSVAACDYIEKHSSKRAILFPIATNTERFNPINKPKLNDEEKKKFISDISFTGSYWNVQREIIGYLKNIKDLPYKCKIFGANWENVEELKEYAEGFTVYENMPKIYYNTKIVIDDANHVTKDYGAVNSRVFDALATGTLVLTNNILGAKETFEGLLPAFENEDDFYKKITYFMENDIKRMELADKLQKFVLENHTYDIRAMQLKKILMDYNKDDLDEHTIDVVCPVPKKAKENWGDYHFACSMKKYFEKEGYNANVILVESWYERSNAKYVIYLRGNKSYYPPENDGKKYIMWNISHPSDVMIDEYNLYDYVFFASEKMKKEKEKKINCKSGVLLQCTDEEVIFNHIEDKKRFELLFIGNSRGVFRTILKDLLPTKHNLSVYGKGWKNFPVNEHVIAEYMDNAVIKQAYHDAKIVLNDHWDDMIEHGIISNRLFDALSAETLVISDYMPEINETFKEAVVTYKTKEDLDEKIKYYLENDEECNRLALIGKKIVLENHTFSIRCKEIISVIENIL